MANAHRMRNCLRNISINGIRLDKEAEIKEGLVDAFQNLFPASRGWRPSLLELHFKEIRMEEASKLEVFSEEEIWTTISRLNGDKAPRPVGSPLAF